MLRHWSSRRPPCSISPSHQCTDLSVCVSHRGCSGRLAFECTACCSSLNIANAWTSWHMEFNCVCQEKRTWDRRFKTWCFPSMPLGVGQISLTNRFVDIVVCQCLDSCLVSETYVLYTAHFLTASTIYIVTCWSHLALVLATQKFYILNLESNGPVAPVLSMDSCVAHWTRL